jgi:hypothetical protein
MIMSTDCHGSCPYGVQDLLGFGMMRCRWLRGDVSVSWRSCVDLGMRRLVYSCMWGVGLMNAWGAAEEKFRVCEIAIGQLRGWRVGKRNRIWATIARFMHPPEDLNSLIAIQ